LGEEKESEEYDEEDCSKSKNKGERKNNEQIRIQNLFNED
jgi:hypothetical protein